MTTNRTTIYRDNEDDKKQKRKYAILALTVATAAGLLAARLYFLWFWPW